MILKKPYAFFIKIFKPMHLMLAAIIGYLIYLENQIVSFLNNYIYTNINVVGQNIKETLVNNNLFIIPIVIIISFILIFSIMFKKQKSVLFYLVGIFVFIAVLVINIYTSNFLGMLEENIIAIKSVKLIHDLVFINIIIETCITIFLIIRGMGINVKKFNFDSEISKINISDSDNEEIELRFNVDLDENKRKRKEKLRFLKYRYVENKILYNSIIGVSILVISLLFIVTFLFLKKSKNVENVIYELNGLELKVNNTYILNTDYLGNKITDKYLVVVESQIKNNYSNTNIYKKDFSLKIENAIFKSTDKYSNKLLDLGSVYYDGMSINEYTNCLFVFEIDEKYIKSEMKFNYSWLDEKIEILLNPKNIESKNQVITKTLNEKIDFNDYFNVQFSIEEYDINNKYKIEYKYCVKENDCMNSIEYITPTINQNYDKDILKIKIDYVNEGDTRILSFYDLFSKFGSIQYKIGDKWFLQSTGFEEIKSNKGSKNNIIYIGVNSNIKNASSIKILFNIRGSKYEYILK